MNQKFGGCFILSIPLQVLVKSQCFSIFGPTVFFRGAHWTLVPCTNRGVSWWQVESLTWTWPSIRNFWGSWGRWSTRYDMCNILIPGTPWELIFPLQFLNCSLENNSRTVICTPERFFSAPERARTLFEHLSNVFWTCLFTFERPNCPRTVKNTLVCFFQHLQHHVAKLLFLVLVLIFPLSGRTGYMFTESFNIN